jgi:hypothetical protein
VEVRGDLLYPQYPPVPRRPRCIVPPAVRVPEDRARQRLRTLQPVPDEPPRDRPPRLPRSPRGKRHRRPRQGLIPGRRHHHQVLKPLPRRASRQVGRGPIRLRDGRKTFESCPGLQARVPAPCRLLEHPRKHLPANQPARARPPHPILRVELKHRMVPEAQPARVPRQHVPLIHAVFPRVDPDRLGDRTVRLPCVETEADRAPVSGEQLPVPVGGVAVERNRVPPVRPGVGPEGQTEEIAPQRPQHGRLDSPLPRPGCRVHRRQRPTVPTPLQPAQHAPRPRDVQPDFRGGKGPGAFAAARS